MSELLKIVLSLSLSGTLLFFVILALKPLYKNKFCKRWQYYIWLIVVVRMLLPFTPETTLIGSAFEYFENIRVETIGRTSTVNDIRSDFSLKDANVTPNAEPNPELQILNQTPDIVPSTPVRSIFSRVYQNLWIIWVIIAFALLIRKITMYQSFVQFVKAGRAEVSDIEILNMLADAGERIGVKRPVELFINPLISSPMLLGFFRPYIILPRIDLQRRELAYIMQHELTHYKHLDMFYKWFVQVMVCLHWFNPFVYLLAREINRCCELACDETMIRTMDKDEKKAYGDTLLNAFEVMGSYNDKLATVTLAESAEQLKERLNAIMRFKKTSKTTVIMMTVLTFAIAMGAASIGVYAAIEVPVSSGNGSAAMVLPGNTKEIAISFDINNGGIVILPAVSNEINASYDSEYYDVSITNKRGEWKINVTGKVSMMGKTEDVQLYIPDVKRTMDVMVLNGNFSYALPENCMDTISITAQNAGIDFSSNNQYKNSAISLAAANQDYLKYEVPVYPGYFTKTNTGFEYRNGTEENKINIVLNGYTSVDFAETMIPRSAMGDTGQPYTYSQAGYYQGAYIFELGWNLNERSFNAYTEKVDFTLSDKTKIEVSFDNACKSEAHNQAVLSDLKKLIDMLRTQNHNSTRLEKPLVVSVTYIGNSELGKLAQEYYTNSQLTRFSAIFSSLGNDTQKTYCTKIIDDEKSAFLSSCAANMESDMLDYCAEKTYQEGKIALFSCIAPYLTESQKQTWIERAARDNKNTFLSVLSEDE